MPKKKKIDSHEEDRFQEFYQTTATFDVWCDRCHRKAGLEGQELPPEIAHELVRLRTALKELAGAEGISVIMNGFRGFYGVPIDFFRDHGEHELTVRDGRGEPLGASAQAVR